jgi:hypothetical protein
MQSLEFSVSHLRWIPHCLSDSQKSKRAESSRQLCSTKMEWHTVQPQKWIPTIFRNPSGVQLINAPSHGFKFNTSQFYDFLGNSLHRNQILIITAHCVFQ